MRICRFQSSNNPADIGRFGLLQNDDQIVTAKPEFQPDYGSLCRWMMEKPGQIPLGFDERIARDSVRLLAPVENPQKVICIGKNYSEHAAEMGGSAPEIPVVFSKFASAIIGPEESVVLPSISHQVDYEAELVIVIGLPGKAIAESEAMNHVLGACCGNDISARDWQKGRPGGQWLVGKTFDTFAPVGPWIKTLSELGDPQALEIQLRLNGQTMQHSNTAHCVFSFAKLISHVSQFVTLQPGDLIFTGTPAGVGAGRDPQVFLKAGDQLEVEIEGLGVLQNPVQSET